MKNLNLLAELVKQFEEEKQVLNGQLAFLYEKQAELRAQQQKISDQISATETEAASITKERIEKYKAFWYSLGANNPPPCPFCFIVNDNHSDLQATPETHKEEHFKCNECGRWFHTPLP